MNFYKRHLGDIAKSCGDLSQGQMGAYDLLLDWHYANEKPLPLNPDKLYRIGRAVTAAERANVDSVLAELFVQTEAGYTHKRASEEMEKANAQADTNRRIAEEREARKRARSVHESLDESSNEQGNESSDGSCTNRQPSQTPDSRLQEKIKSPPVVPHPGDGICPAVLDAYHSTLPKCQRCETLTPKRRKRIQHADKLARQLCEQQGWNYEPAEFWQAYFGECLQDPWLRGEVPHKGNPRWKQNLDVLLHEDRFAGIMDAAIGAMREAA